jgi:hypothetical protein
MVGIHMRKSIWLSPAEPQSYLLRRAIYTGRAVADRTRIVRLRNGNRLSNPHDAGRVGSLQGVAQRRESAARPL